MPSAISTDSDSTYASLSVPANCRKIKATCQQTIDGKLREVVLGQLNCERYDPQTRNVILVSINGASLPVSNTDLQTALNSIYGQAVSNWQVSADLKKIDIADLSTIDDGDNELCSKYTGDMKTLIQAYKDNIGDLPDENTVCLFICKDAKSGSKQGYMPLKGRFGFLFTKQLTDAATAKRTSAHELAHGTFRLWHTFSTNNEYLFPERSTDNLMDYNNGSALYQYQWGFVHNPESMWFAWSQDEGEGAALAEPGYLEFVQNNTQYNSDNFNIFLSPSGLPVYIDAPKELIVLKDHAQDLQSGKVFAYLNPFPIYGFVDKNGIQWSALIDKNDNFIGYADSKRNIYNSKKLIDKAKESQDPATLNQGYPPHWNVGYWNTNIKKFVVLSFCDNVSLDENGGYTAAGILMPEGYDLEKGCSRCVAEKTSNIIKLSYKADIWFRRDLSEFGYGKKDGIEYYTKDGITTLILWRYNEQSEKFTTYRFVSYTNQTLNGRDCPGVWMPCSIEAPEAKEQILELLGALQILDAVPVIGDAVDLVLAPAFYLCGDSESAAFCLAAAVPMAINAKTFKTFIKLTKTGSSYFKYKPAATTLKLINELRKTDISPKLFSKVCDELTTATYAVKDNPAHLSVIENILSTRNLTNVAEVESAANAYAQINKLDVVQFTTILDDIANSTSLSGNLNKLVAKDIEAWKVLNEAGEIETIRREFGNTSIIRNHLAQNSTKTAEALTKEIIDAGGYALWKDKAAIAKRQELIKADIDLWEAAEKLATQEEKWAHIGISTEAIPSSILPQMKTVAAKHGFSSLEEIIYINFNASIGKASTADIERAREFITDMFPDPKRGEMLKKAIPLQAGQRYPLGIAVTSDKLTFGGFVGPQNAWSGGNLDQVMEKLRLDYVTDGGIVNKMEDGFITIESKYLDGTEKLIRPKVGDEYPFTGTGMLATKKGILPEFKFETGEFQELSPGALLTKYDVDGKVTEVWKLEKDKFDKTKNIFNRIQ